MAGRREEEEEIPELPGFESSEYEDEIPELGEYQEEPERSWLDTAGDLLAGVSEGGSFGGLRPIKSGPLEGVRPALELASTVAPSLSMLRDGPVGGLLEGLLDARDRRAEEASGTVAGQAGEALGRAGSSAALGAVAGPGLAAQAATGAGTGALSAAEESGGDPLTMLAGGASGAAFGLGGGLIGKSADAIADGSGAVLEALKSPSLRQWFDRPVRSGFVAGARGLAQRPDAMRTIAAGGRALGQAGAAGAGKLEGMVGRAFAQDVAHGGSAPTMAWAVQSVLTQGSGLPPAENQRLLEAVSSGDMNALIAANFALQQRYPGYASRIQRELEGLHEED